MTLRESLEQSRNIPTIKLANEVGIKKILEFLDRINVKGKYKKDLSLSLGSFGITLLDIVKGYSIFVNGGNKVVNQAFINFVEGKSARAY